MIDATEENSSWVISCCLGKGVVDPDVTVVSSILAVVLSYDLGVQGDLSEDGLWEIGHIDVALGLFWDWCARRSSGSTMLLSGFREYVLLLDGR